ncbi:MAG TPA: ComEC/Rec2 family competence protein, partial [Burkholderiales bacterium]|nr:ComEC/Rec2 family competence protein [Burkholderiales bacterium]
LAGAGWLLLPRGFPARYLGVVALLPLFLVFPAQPQDGELRLIVLDVGHGLAVIAQTREHSLLYDAGPSFSPGSDTGNRIIVPYLRAAGIRQLDGMIVSHDDADHHGGAESVLQAVPVAWLMSSLPDLDPLPLQAQDAVRCFSGQQWTWDGVRFEVLHPARGSYDEGGIRDNDRSCVLRITTAGGSVLLPADIELASERGLVMADAPLAAEVLVAPHQGSKSSSSAPFVDAVRPRVVIFPIGYRNRFGHPHPDVIARYRAAGAALYRTDQDGAVLITLGAHARAVMQSYRNVYRRYWHARSEAGAGRLDSDLATFLE